LRTESDAQNAIKLDIFYCYLVILLLRIVLSKNSPQPFTTVSSFCAVVYKIRRLSVDNFVKDEIVPDG